MSVVPSRSERGIPVDMKFPTRPRSPMCDRGARSTIASAWNGEARTGEEAQPALGLVTLLHVTLFLFQATI